MAEAVSKLKIDNTVDVVFLKREKLPIFYANLLLGKGAIHETSKRGIHNFTLKMITEGPKGKSPVEFSRELERLGLRLKVRAGYSISSFELDGLSDFFLDGIKEVKEVLTNPAFREEDFKRMRDQYITAVQLGFQDPEFVASYFSNYFYFQEVPELQPLPDFGIIKDVLSLEPGELQKYYSGLLSGTQLTLVVVSNLDLKAHYKELDVLKGIVTGGASSFDLPTANFEFEKVYIVDMDIEQAHIRLMTPAVARKDSFHYALMVSNFIFGGSDLSSRLMRRLRVKEGLTYSVSSSYNSGIPVGEKITAAYCAVSSETELKNARKAYDLIMDEVSNIAREGFSKEELQDAIAFFKGSIPLRVESYAQILSMITEEVIYRLPYFHWEEEIAEIENLNLELVNEAARRFLSFKKPFILIVGKASQLKKQFEDFDTEIVEPENYIR